MRVVLGSVLLVLSALLAACDDEAESTKAGDIINARLDDQFKSGREAIVRIPTGQLLIHAADPVGSASSDETRTREKVSAPSGGTLVPISWQYDPWASDRLYGILDSTDTPIVDLVSDGEHYRLRPPTPDAEGGESFYVVVDGDAEERSLEIAFDGVTQSVNLKNGRTDKSSAAGLYDISDDRLKKKGCDEEKWFESAKTSAEFSCDLIGPVLTPYAGGEWAPDGSLWLALTVETTLRGYSLVDLLGGGARYSATSVKVKAKIDDEKPEFELSTNSPADTCPVAGTYTCGWSRSVVFEVPADDGEQGPLDLKVKYHLLRAAAFGEFDPPTRKVVKDKQELKIWKD